jgi:hypothetical protein
MTRARIFARAGLLGNPSDLYGGRVLAFTFEQFFADVSLVPAPHVQVESHVIASDACFLATQTVPQAPREQAGLEHFFYESLVPAPEPGFFIAYDERRANHSGATHAAVLQRFRAGDPTLSRVMRELADLAEQGREWIRCGDVDRLPAAMNRNYALRRQVFEIPPAQHELIALARSRGRPPSSPAPAAPSLACARIRSSTASCSRSFTVWAFVCWRPRLPDPPRDDRLQRELACWG